MANILRFVFGSMENCEGCGVRPVPMFHCCAGGLLAYGGYTGYRNGAARQQSEKKWKGEIVGRNEAVKRLLARGKDAV